MTKEKIHSNSQTDNFQSEMDLFSERLDSERQELSKRKERISEAFLIGSMRAIDAAGKSFNKQCWEIFRLKTILLASEETGVLPSVMEKKTPTDLILIDSLIKANKRVLAFQVINNPNKFKINHERVFGEAHRIANIMARGLTIKINEFKWKERIASLDEKI